MNQILFEVAKKTSEEIVKRIATHAAIGAAIDTTFALANKNKRNIKDLSIEFLCGAVSGAASGGAGELHDHFRDKKDKIRTIVVAASSLSTRYAMRKISEPKVNNEDSKTVFYDGDEYYDEDDYDYDDEDD